MTVMERFGLQGRRTLVTGASGGLGHHFALSLAQAGAAVIVAARSVDKLAETVAEIKAAGGEACAVRLEVTDPVSVKTGFDQIEAAGGVADVIVNNAGLAVSRPLLEQTEADWDTVLDTNLKGAWLVAQKAARRLVAAKRPGSIINIASTTGERVAGGVAPYCTSKAGVMHLTRAMALELARHGIRVNALAPGFAYHVMSWRVSADEFRGIKGADLARLGIPEEADYVQAYCRRTGRESIDDWDYYLAFNMFRMTAILQGILARAMQGNATSSEALATGRRARPMADAGWRQVEQMQARQTC
jgi:NAD(P)-dependent dehydrogenase (short-subunit alcohol dehydrogenase family)